MEPSIIADLAAWAFTVSPAETAGRLWKVHVYRPARYRQGHGLVDIGKARP